MLSLQRPYSAHCDFGSGLFSVPLELSGQKESWLRYAAKTNYRTENYQLTRHVLQNGVAALQVTLDEIQVELFASQQKHIMQLYCSKHLSNAFRFFGKAKGAAYADPPFSLLAKVLAKIAYDLAHANCTPLFSPKHLDSVTEKNGFFCHLEKTFFSKPPEKCIFHQFCPFFAVFRGVK